MRKASVARVHGHPPLGGSIQLNLEKKEEFIYEIFHPQALGAFDICPSLVLLGGMHRQRTARVWSRPSSKRKLQQRERLSRM